MFFCYFLCANYGSTGYGVFKGGIQNKKGLWLKTVVKWTYQILRIGVVANFQRVTKFNFIVNFLCQKSSESFWFFSIEEYEFRSTFILLLTFFDTIHFKIPLFSKMMANFRHLVITPIIKIWKFHLTTVDR